MVIYKLENLQNGKVYIGQTNDYNQRMRAHKSTAYNQKSKDHNIYLYNAIRKYGWDNFSKEIIEQIPEEQNQDYVNEREIYYIKLYDSTNKNKGYNIELGGTKGSEKRKKLTLEEKVKISKLFNLEEIKDIHRMLLEGLPMEEIRNKYSPKLKPSLLNNINSGLNFKDENLSYPLHDYVHDGSLISFSKEDQESIRQDIINGKLTYKQIAKKWGIKSIGLISQINNGKTWRKEGLEYPLSTRNNSRLHNFRTWVKPMQQDLLSGKFSLQEIADKYEKSYATVKKINDGYSYHNENYNYPLKKKGRPNRKPITNKKNNCFKNDVSTILGQTESTGTIDTFWETACDRRECQNSDTEKS